MAALRCY